MRQAPYPSLCGFPICQWLWATNSNQAIVGSIEGCLARVEIPSDAEGFEVEVIESLICMRRLRKVKWRKRRWRSLKAGCLIWWKVESCRIDIWDDSKDTKKEKYSTYTCYEVQGWRVWHSRNLVMASVLITKMGDTNQRWSKIVEESLAIIVTPIPWAIFSYMGNLCQHKVATNCEN